MTISFCVPYDGRAEGQASDLPPGPSDGLRTPDATPYSSAYNYDYQKSHQVQCDRAHAQNSCLMARLAVRAGNREFSSRAVVIHVLVPLRLLLQVPPRLPSTFIVVLRG